MCRTALNKKRNLTPLIIIVFSVFSLTVYSNDDVDYYINRYSFNWDKYGGRVDNDCAGYLIGNVDKESVVLRQLVELYRNNKHDDIISTLNSEIYLAYLSKLQDCGNAYKFKGEIDYFREAYNKMTLLDHIYRNSIRENEKQHIENLTTDVLEYLSHIKNSKFLNN